MKTKIVNQYDGKTIIASYSSIALASELTEAQSAHIGKVANGKRETAGGYSWKFTNRLSSMKNGVTMKNTDGEELAVFSDIETAATMSGVSTKKIQNAMKTSKTAGGYLWS